MQADEMSQVPGSVSYLTWDGKGMPGKATPDDVADRSGIPGAESERPVTGPSLVHAGEEEPGVPGVVDPRPNQGER